VLGFEACTRQHASFPPAAGLFCMRLHLQRRTTASFRRSVRVFRTIRVPKTSNDFKCAAGIVHHPRLLRHLISFGGQGNCILSGYFLGGCLKRLARPGACPESLQEPVNNFTRRPHWNPARLLSPLSSPFCVRTQATSLVRGDGLSNGSLRLAATTGPERPSTAVPTSADKYGGRGR